MSGRVGRALPFRKTGKYKQWELKGLSEDETVLFIKFSPCCRLLAVAFRKSVKIFRLNFFELEREEILVYHSDFSVEDIKWSPDSGSLMIISVQCSYFVLLQNVQEINAQSVYRIEQFPSVKLIFIDWVPNGQYLILVSSYNIFSCVHRVSDGNKILIPSICCFMDEKPLMSFNSDGQYLAAITYHGSSYHVALLSTNLWIKLWTRKLEFVMIRGLEWSPNSEMLAVLDSSQHLRILDVSGECVRTLHYSAPSVSGFFFVSFSKNLLAATCLRDKKKVNLILLYNLITWQLSEILEQTFSIDYSNHLTVDTKLAFSFCGNFLASCLSDDAIVIWNLTECCKPSTLENIQNPVLQWHPKQAKLACFAGNQMFIWKCIQDDPVVETRICLFETKITSVSKLSWAKKNIVLQNSQSAVMLIKSKISKKKRPTF